MKYFLVRIVLILIITSSFLITNCATAPSQKAPKVTIITSVEITDLISRTEEIDKAFLNGHKNEVIWGVGAIEETYADAINQLPQSEKKESLRKIVRAYQMVAEELLQDNQVSAAQKLGFAKFIRDNAASTLMKAEKKRK